jgi:hypothetical protein
MLDTPVPDGELPYDQGAGPVPEGNTPDEAFADGARYPELVPTGDERLPEAGPVPVGKIDNEAFADGAGTDPDGSEAGIVVAEVDVVET